MDEQLKAGFRHEELAVAAAIGNKQDQLSGKIQELFSVFVDPLLSKEEIMQLLGTEDSDDDYVIALDTLGRDEFLESSEATQRPLDQSEGLKLYRKKLAESKRLKIMALEARINGEVRYQFTFDGRLVRSLAKIDRLDAIAGTGQQRQEILSHVRKIAEGIINGTHIPNPILLTLNQSNCSIDPDPEDSLPDSFIVIRGLSEPVEIFHPFIPTQQIQTLRTVELDFPFRPAAFDDEKTALLVDGQQRTAALALVPVDGHAEVMLSTIAMIADGDEAKKIFRVANSTQKITTEFSRALIASMDYESGYLRTEQVKARACKILAIDNEHSPFKGLVRYPGVPRVPGQVIAYNSIFQVVSKFAESGLPGIEDNPDLLATSVARYFTIVKDTWPEAWGKRPSESRLMHGAGLRSMASLGEELLRSAYRNVSSVTDEALMTDDAWKDVRASVERLRPTVLWDTSAMEGNANQRKNYTTEIDSAQNTNQSIAKLTNFLVKESLAADKRAKEKK